MMAYDENTMAVSESELARRVSVSIAALRKWRREGTGPRFLKLGRLVRYLLSDVDAWLDSQTFAGGQHQEQKRSNPYY